MDTLIAALLDGDRDRTLTEARRLHMSGTSPETIVTNGLEVAMRQLDQKCTVESFNLLEIMLVGRAVSSVVSEFYPEGIPPEKGKSTFVIGTIEGDIHDLGKNIVKTVLTGMNYRVIDLGRDCPVQRLVAAAEREKAEAVLVSGLITSIIPEVRKLREALALRGLDSTKVVAGGAALRQATAIELNVDYVAETAFDGARYLDQLFGGRHEQH